MIDKITQVCKIGDCRELLKDVESGSIDLVFTSPPYNVGIDYGVYDDNLPYDEYLGSMEDVIKELYRVVGSTGRIVYNVPVNYKRDGVFQHPYVDYVNIIKGAGFNVVGTPLWYDNTHVKQTAWGSWLSASAPYFYNPHEMLIIACKGEWKRDKTGKEDSVRKAQFMSMCNGMIAFPTASIEGHPAPFSLKMAMTVIECLSFVGDTVLDPFCGSGTVLDACRKTQCLMRVGRHLGMGLVSRSTLDMRN
jgi:site-specific DNA-methyltransferase (adenine-specific)